MNTPTSKDLLLFLRHVDTGEPGCWNWKGKLNHQGYGNFNMLGQAMRSHRAAYILLVGPVEPKMHVHHICGNRGCVRPEHLSLISGTDHIRVHYEAITAAHPRRGMTHCSRGHLYDEANTRIFKDGRRACKQCDHDTTFERRRQRGETPGRGRDWHRSITHCPKGHLYDEANTHRAKNGGRICKACNRERQAGLRLQRKQQE